MSYSIAGLKSLPTEVSNLIWQQLDCKDLVNFKWTSKAGNQLISPHLVGQTLARLSHLTEVIARAFSKLYPIKAQETTGDFSRLDPNRDEPISEYRQELMRGFYDQADQKQASNALSCCNSAQLVWESGQYISSFEIKNPYCILPTRERKNFLPWTDPKQTDILARMTRIKHLTFHGMSWNRNHPIPAENFCFLHQITSLTKLELHFNETKNQSIKGEIDFSFISNMRLLNSIRFSHSYTNSIKNFIFYCIHLTKLTDLGIVFFGKQEGDTLQETISRDLFNHIPTTLESLFIHNIEFTGEIEFKQLRKFTNLTSLTFYSQSDFLSGNHFAPTLTPLKLSYLKLSCFFVDKATPFMEAIKSHTTLKELELFVHYPKRQEEFLPSAEELQKALPSCQIEVEEVKEKWSDEMINLMRMRLKRSQNIAALLDQTKGKLLHYKNRLALLQAELPNQETTDTDEERPLKRQKTS